MKMWGVWYGARYGEAIAFPSLAEAEAHFRAEAPGIADYAPDMACMDLYRSDPNEVADHGDAPCAAFHLSLGPRGGVRRERW